MDPSTVLSPSADAHRLFVGLPIDIAAASAIQAWAEAAYNELPVRVVDADQIHSTLLFYASVTDSKRDWMADLVRSVEWQSIEVCTGDTLLLGRGALALELALPDEVANRLDERLIRSNYQGDYAEFYRLQQEPLGQLSLEQSSVEWEPRRRNHRHGRILKLHATFARCGKRTSESAPLHRCPPISVHLSRVALYESHLGPDGPRYAIIAESS